MPREIDERKKRKALRKLRRAADLAARGEGPPLSDWEKEFLEEVEQRIEQFGSAFNDPDKGSLEDPMSALQTQKLREIDKKARGKGSGLKTRKPLGAKKKPAYTPRVRQLNDDIDMPEETEAQSVPDPETRRKALGIVRASDLDTPKVQPAAPKKPASRPAFKVIKGGKDDA